MATKDLIKKIEKWYDEEDNADSFLYVFVSTNEDGKLTVDYDYTGKTENIAKSLAHIALFNLVLEQDSLEEMLKRVSAVKEMIENEIKKKTDYSATTMIF